MTNLTLPRTSFKRYLKLANNEHKTKHKNTNNKPSKLRRIRDLKPREVKHITKAVSRVHTAHRAYNRTSNSKTSKNLKVTTSQLFSLQDALHLGGDAAKAVWDNRNLIGDLGVGTANLVTGNFLGAAENGLSALTRIPKLYKSARDVSRRYRDRKTRTDNASKRDRGRIRRDTTRRSMPSWNTIRRSTLLTSSNTDNTSASPNALTLSQNRGTSQGTIYEQPRAQGYVTTEDFGGSKVYRSRRFVKNLTTPPENEISSFNTQVFQVTPTNASLFTWLSAIAHQYQQYKIHHLNLVFKPILGTDTDGTISMGFYMDPESPPAFSKTSLLNLQHSESGPMWIAQQASLDDAELDTRKVFFTSPDEDDRNASTQLLFIVGTSFAVPDTEFGELWIEYDIEFSAPRIGTACSIYGVGRNTPLPGDQGMFDDDTKVTAFNFVAQLGKPNANSVTFLNRGTFMISAFAIAGEPITPGPPPVIVVEGKDTTLNGPSISSEGTLPNHYTWNLTIASGGAFSTTVILPDIGFIMTFMYFSIVKLNSEPNYSYFPETLSVTSSIEEIAQLERADNKLSLTVRSLQEGLAKVKAQNFDLSKAVQVLRKSQASSSNLTAHSSFYSDSDSDDA